MLSNDLQKNAPVTVTQFKIDEIPLTPEEFQGHKRTLMLSRTFVMSSLEDRFYLKDVNFKHLISTVQ